MVNRLHVWLAGTHVADVARRAGRLTLTYTDAAVPLSVSMPTALGTHRDATVRPWLAGLLPDDERVLERWARRLQVAVSPFALLGSEVGLDCAGAVQFTTEGAALPGTRDSGVRWLDEAELEALVVDLHEDRTGWGQRTVGGRFSLAGAQTKVALRVEGDRVGVPYGDEPSNVIVKPALPGLDAHEVNEHLCMAAADACGITVAPTRLWEVAGRRLLMTSRYDRRRVDGHLVRVHQEDVCQALSVAPTSRYQNEGGPGPRDVAELLRTHLPPTVGEEDVRRFADALLLNWLLAGTDAHAKNYSLLHVAPGHVRLAPLYDVASIAPYEDVLAAKLAMKLGGEYRFKAIVGDRNIATMARELGIPPQAALTRADDLAARLPDAIADRIRADGLKGDPAATALLDAVTEHIRRVRPGN